MYIMSQANEVALNNTENKQKKPHLRITLFDIIQVKY